MSETGKITQAELVEIFGEAMPIEAVKLLWDSPGEMTIDEMRAKLREIAAVRPLPKDDELVSRLRELKPGRTGVGRARLFNRDGPESAAEIERLSGLLVRARKALRPWAKIADEIDEGMWKTMPECVVPDIRSARQVYQALSEPDGAHGTATAVTSYP